MSSEMEQIEARLAAYIDGVLPPDQRAEIEAYLAANPGHGRLISELKSIKSAVANLPKEKAPAEVMDGVQAQLERAVLLEDVEDPAARARVNRWPQVGAIAAVLLLTAGLGFLVLQVLPQQKSAGPDYALLPDSTKPNVPDSELPDTPIVLDAPVSRPATEARVGLASPALTQQTPAGSPPPSAVASPSPAELGGTDGTSAARATTLPNRFAIGSAVTPSYYTQRPSGPASAPASAPADRVVAAAPAPAGPQLVVVQTADPLLTRNLWAARAASTGHAVRSGVGAPLQTSADTAVLTPSPIAPGEPFLVVSDVVLPGPSTRPYAEADAASLFDATPPATRPVAQVVAAKAFGVPAASQPASRPAAVTGDLLAVFRPGPPPSTAPATNRPATGPAGLP